MYKRLSNKISGFGTATKLFVGALCTSLFSLNGSADQIPLGAGFISTIGSDSGERLNVTDAPLSFGAGTWNVSNFMFDGTSAAGTVTPFIGRLNGTDSYETLWVGNPVSSANGKVIVSPESTFTLTGSTDLYAGFYTEGGGRVAFNATGPTDHDNAFTNPTVSSTVNGFSNANLARTYSFALALSPASASIELGAGAQWTTGADSGDRLNVDQGYGRQLAAGQYLIEDMTFFGTSATGTVTPFLALSTGADSYDIAWVGSPIASANGLVVGTQNQVLNVPSDARYVPGFYTTGGRVAFNETVPSNTDVYGITDHWATAFAAPLQGQNISGFSNPNLNRRYAFDISLSAVPEPSSGFLMIVGLLVLRRSLGRISG